MEWQQLEYFKTVARLEHITEASIELAITQPALSRSISRLEEELGVPLFDRRGRSIQLNRYGEIFLKRVNRMLAEYDSAREELDGLLQPDGGEVAIGFVHTLGAAVIPDLISKFQKIYPKSRFSLTQNSSNALLDELDEAKIDFCFGSYFDHKTELDYVDLYSEKLHVLVPSAHPLANQKSIDIIDLANVPIVSFKKGYGLRTLLEQFFEKHNIKPIFAFEGDDVHTIAGLVSSGLGVGIVPDIQYYDESKIVKLPINDNDCKRVVSFTWNKTSYLSPIALKFKDFVLKSWEDNQL